MLTRGTMPVLAGMRAVLQVPARGALGKRPAEGLGPALFDGRHGCEVTWGHPVGACGAVGWAIASEDRRSFEQGSPPEAPRELPGGD